MLPPKKIVSLLLVTGFSATESLSCSDSGVPKSLDCGSGQDGSTALECGNFGAQRPSIPGTVSSGHTGIPEVVNFKEIGVPRSMKLGIIDWCL